jgi:hypothetical protein
MERAMIHGEPPTTASLVKRIITSSCDHIIHHSIENVSPLQQLFGLATKTDPFEEEEML